MLSSAKSCDTYVWVQVDSERDFFDILFHQLREMWSQCHEQLLGNSGAGHPGVLHAVYTSDSWAEKCIRLVVFIKSCVFDCKFDTVKLYRTVAITYDFR